MLQTFYRNEGGNLTKTSLARNTNYLRHFLPPPFFFFFFSSMLFSTPSPSFSLLLFFFQMHYDDLQRRLFRQTHRSGVEKTNFTNYLFEINCEHARRPLKRENFSSIWHRLIVRSFFTICLFVILFLFFPCSSLITKLCENILIPLISLACLSYIYPDTRFFSTSTCKH